MSSYYVCLDCKDVSRFSQDHSYDKIEWLIAHWGHNALIVWVTSDNELNPQMLSSKFKGEDE